MAAASLSSSLLTSAAEPRTEEAGQTQRDPLTLWYDRPVSQMKHGLASGGGNYPGDDNAWQQLSLPVGNGDMGANVFGDIETERLTFNEKTLWTGGPSKNRPSYMGGNLESKGQNGQEMKAIQSLFLSGQDTAASSRCSNLVGTSEGYGSYQSWGSIYLDFQGLNSSAVTDYSRDLNLNNGIAGVRFDQNGVHYEREYFISHPDNVLAMKISASQGQSLNFDIRFPSNQGGTPAASGDSILLHGEVSDNQLQYSSLLRADSPDGTISANGTKLTVREATSVTIYVSAATDYKNDYPVYRTGETMDQLDARVRTQVDAALEKGYDAVRQDHIQDYSSLFGRLSLQLTDSASERTTDQLLAAYKNGSASEAEKRQLETMLFQYGRYLTIASSREDSQLPSNLQGVWCVNNTPPWSSDYHMNVNLQMNYWPTYSTNLAECALPLVSYVDSLREPGRVTAKIYAGIESTEENPENGFMAHTQNTPFGWTCPGWSFDWGWSPAAVPWILQNVWEYYDYTRDEEFLRDVIYPMMKEEATLYDQMLVRTEDGELVSAPSYSPEHGPRTAGNTYEHSLIWQLYEDTIHAAEILGVDADRVEVWKQNQADLKGPIEIGDSGQIKEWYSETTLDSAPGEGYGHRHLSHMLGLFPGDLITADNTEYFEAARVSMNARTDASTGWGMGQRINTWARLKDGDRALKLIGDLFKNGIYANLWDTHTPYQIDGNFGMTSGVAEMLLQSHAGYMDLLPALPADWDQGQVEGLKARGDFTLDMTWSECSLEEVHLTSGLGNEAVVQAPGIALADVLDAGSGDSIETVLISPDRISFDTEAGHTYIISGLPARETAEAAPTGARAFRESEDTVSLEWDAAEDVTWTVYKKQSDGSILKLAENLDTPSFADAQAWQALGEVQYAISAVQDGEESLKTPWITPSDLRSLMGMVDDTDPAISWTGAWGDWKESVNYNGTIKYLENLTGQDSAELTFVGTGIEVISCTNHDRGMLEISIDGEVAETVDTYTPSTVRQSVVFSTTDLDYGRHTIKVRATNTKNSASSWEKVEIDAFRILNTQAVPAESLQIDSANGLHTVAIPGSTLQMKASVLPEEASFRQVTWSVTSPAGSSTSLASIDENGLLQFGQDSGTVLVHAALKNDPSITATLPVSLALPEEAGTPVETESIVEDAVQTDGSWVLNPAITWNGSWSTWAGEPEKHHGITKTEAHAPASLSFAWTGSTVEIYVQKHQNFSSFDIVLDGENKGNFSLNGSSSGDPQSLLASFETEEGDHVLEMTVAARGSTTQANLDYFRVLSVSEADGLDKSVLQSRIEEGSALYPQAYTEASWNDFAQVLQAAVDVMNADDTDQAAIDAAAESLETARETLVSVQLPAPDLSDCDFRILGSRRDALLLGWNVVPDAVLYEIVDAQTKEVLTSTDSLSVLFDGLESDGTYRLMLQAVGADGQRVCSAVLEARTLPDEDTEAPAIPAGFAQETLPEGKIRLTWQAAEDPSGIREYRIWENGVILARVQTPEWIADLPAAARTVKVTAVDGAGNESLPASVTLRKEAGQIAEVLALPPLEAVAPIAFADLQLPATVQVRLSDGSLSTVSVRWSDEGFSGDTAGVYTLCGELVLKQDLTNPLDLKASVQISVKEKTAVHKELLQEAVDYADTLKEEADLSVINVIVLERFNTALEQAKAVLADETADQDAVNAAWEELTYAIHLMGFTADKSALQALIAECQTIDLSLYKDGPAKDAFVAALHHAVEISESSIALDASIQEALQSLQAAREALEPASEVDTRMLAWLVAQTENEDLSQYANTAEFEAALEQAKNVLLAPESQQAVDGALSALSQAWLNLRLKPSEAMLEELRAFVKETDSLDLSLYAEEDAQLILLARNQVLSALNNPHLTREEAQDVLHGLEKARESMEKVQKPQNPAVSDPAVQPEQKPDAESTKKPALEPMASVVSEPDQKVEESARPVRQSVKTAASAGLSLSLGSAAAALGVAGLLKSRNRRKKGTLNP